MRRLIAALIVLAGLAPLPALAHPHIFIDMGKDTETVCSYCSTHYVFNPQLAPGTSEPLSAVYHAEPA